MREIFGDKDRIEILHVREANQFVHRGVVADIAFEVGMGLAPFRGGDAKKGYIEYVSFIGINTLCLLGGDFFGDKVATDGIGVDMVVYFR